MRQEWQLSHVQCSACSSCLSVSASTRPRLYRSHARFLCHSTAFSEFQPLLILIVSLGSYSAVFGHTLTASVAFPTLNFLSILRAPLVQFPDGELDCITSVRFLLPTDGSVMQRSTQLGHG